MASALHVEFFAAFTFHQRELVVASDLFFEGKRTAGENVMFGGRHTVLLVFNRAVLELIDHHDRVAVVADPIRARAVFDRAVKACLLGPYEKNRAITRQYIDPGGEGFLVILTLFAGDGELVASEIRCAP